MTQHTNLSFALKLFVIVLAIIGYERQTLVQARRRSQTFPLELRASLFSNEAQIQLGPGGSRDLGTGMVLYDDGTSLAGGLYRNVLDSCANRFFFPLHKTISICTFRS